MFRTLFAQFLVVQCVLFAQGPSEEVLTAKRWEGDIEVWGQHQGQSPGGGTYQLSVKATAKVLLTERKANLSFHGGWDGKMTSGTFEVKYEGKGKGHYECPYVDTFEVSGPIVEMTNAMMLFNRDAWSFGLGFNSPQGTARRVFHCPDKPPEESPWWRRENTRAAFAFSPTGLPFPGAGGELRDEGRTHQVAFDSGAASGTGAVPLQYRAVFRPAGSTELKLEVTSEQYRDWLPSATRDGSPGQPLRMKATLVAADGSTPKVEIESFEWELVDTSKEPGIAMNWPNLYNQGDGVEFDLRFKPQGRQTAADAQAQRMKLEYPRSLSDTAVIEPLDWGGWSVLRVTAKGAGKTWVGEHKPTGDTDIRLPRRAKDSIIAAKWKETYGASGSDESDNESDPEGEPGCDGDGLTLYEEYRGFYENGTHVYADPKRKDLFIYNRCGGVAESGIQLYGRMTGLNLHHRMLQEERCFSGAGDDDTINAYHAKAPHRVNQHRIDILVCGATKSRGGGTRTKGGAGEGMRLRPKDVENLYIEGPDQKFWAEQYGVQPASAARQFDVAVAHELAHATGVDHHGEGDGAGKFVVLRASEPGNTTGQDGLFRVLSGYYPIKIYDERTGRDLTPELVQRALRIRQQAADVYAQEFPQGTTPEQDRWSKVMILQVGVRQGEHSGAENCVMRYWLADAFLKTGDSPNLYLVPDGTEPVGFQLCDTTQGQDVNMPGRQPQPRYYDAAGGRGRCKFWVCVNDAIPGKPSAIVKEAK